ncbi:AP2 domain-containing protein [Babesia ovata]|uniref:AP2 domain-containing protein n=1 Tax=Babesia ovata TaxID=189622 RepID=A0A2H6K8F6_9APIC|nr:AP2 domain-containing protein [Babesia ovata]GBE59276.1 AP2 domain-containing protein [Babesia ovata]
MGKVSPRRRRRASNKGIPKNAVIVPNVPMQDYCSQIPGVYYHFGKLEWRTTCRDPFNCSKRSQRTFGVRKYGFYEAKMMAEVAAFEWEKHRNFVLYLQTASAGNAVPGHVHSPPPAPPGSPQYYPYLPYECYTYVPAELESPLTPHASMEYYNNAASQLSNI